jgi:hypothetical protein
MPAWFDHVEKACQRADVEPSYVFAMGDQDPTLPVIDLARSYLQRSVTIVGTDEAPTPDVRDWGEARFRHMVEIRNLLLAEVRRAGPDLFLSLDSDILVHPDAIADLIESTARFGAVGGAAFMSESGEFFPNCGWVLGMTGFSRRYMEHRGVIPVDVIMAVKMMTPAAFAVDYAYRPDGEDIGWSLAAAAAGVRLGWDNRHCSKHLWSPASLTRFDERSGF